MVRKFWLLLSYILKKTNKQDQLNNGKEEFLVLTKTQPSQILYFLTTPLVNFCFLLGFGLIFFTIRSDFNIL